MLGVKKYEQSYVDACRARVDADVAAYRKLSGAKALGAFESRFFNAMVLVLDHSFTHRLRVVEGKDGNPLNEVRVLAESIMSNGGKMGVDKTIKMAAEKTVLKYEAGDEIEISEADFVQLAKAFFAEIETKFV